MFDLFSWMNTKDPRIQRKKKSTLYFVPFSIKNPPILEKFTMYYYAKKSFKNSFHWLLLSAEGKRVQYIYCTQGMGSGKEKGVP